MSYKTYQDTFSDRPDLISPIKGLKSKVSENSMKHFMLSGSRNELDNKRLHSTVLAEVAEENSEKTHNAKNENYKLVKNESCSKNENEQTQKSQIKSNLEKKKPHKIIVLKDYNPADEEALTRGPMLPKSSSSSVIGIGPPCHVGPLSRSNRKSSNKLLFT